MLQAEKHSGELDPVKMYVCALCSRVKAHVFILQTKAEVKDRTLRMSDLGLFAL